MKWLALWLILRNWCLCRFGFGWLCGRVLDRYLWPEDVA